jgi:hypothetical protein
VRYKKRLVNINYTLWFDSIVYNQYQLGLVD